MIDQNILHLLSKIGVSREELNSWQMLLPELDESEKKEFEEILKQNISERDELLKKHTAELQNLLNQWNPK